MTEQAEMLTIAEATKALGVTEWVIRRRIKRGQLAAIQVERPQGYEWRVALRQDTPDAPSDALGRQLADSQQVLGALVAQLASERERTAALEQERAELYGRLGFYQAQLEQAKERIALLEAPQHTPKRPWWRFWE